MIKNVQDVFLIIILIMIKLNVYIYNKKIVKNFKLLNVKNVKVIIF